MVRPTDKWTKGDVIHYFWITGALLSVIIFLNTTHVLISKNSDFCEAEEDVDDFLMRNDLLRGLPKSTLGLKGKSMTNSTTPTPSSGNIESSENTDIGSSGDKTVSDPGVTVEEVTVPKEWVPKEELHQQQLDLQQLQELHQQRLRYILWTSLQPEMEDGDKSKLLVWTNF